MQLVGQIYVCLSDEISPRQRSRPSLLWLLEANPRLELNIGKTVQLVGDFRRPHDPLTRRWKTWAARINQSPILPLQLFVPAAEIREMV